MTAFPRPTAPPPDWQPAQRASKRRLNALDRGSGMPPVAARDPVVGLVRCGHSPPIRTTDHISLHHLTSRGVPVAQPRLHMTGKVPAPDVSCAGQIEHGMPLIFPLARAGLIMRGPGGRGLVHGSAPGGPPWPGGRRLHEWVPAGRTRVRPARAGRTTACMPTPTTRPGHASTSNTRGTGAATSHPSGYRRISRCSGSAPSRPAPTSPADCISRSTADRAASRFRPDRG